MNRKAELVGYTNCGGCPGGNIEYAPEEMKKNGADVIHVATGFLVGYARVRTSTTGDLSHKISIF